MIAKCLAESLTVQLLKPQNNAEHLQVGQECQTFPFILYGTCIHLRRVAIKFSLYYLVSVVHPYEVPCYLNNYFLHTLTWEKTCTFISDTVANLFISLMPIDGLHTRIG